MTIGTYRNFKTGEMRIVNVPCEPDNWLHYNYLVKELGEDYLLALHSLNQELSVERNTPEAEALACWVAHQEALKKRG